MNTLTMKDLDFKGKRTLVRVDYNVPFHEDGSIADATRIKESLSTLQYLLDKGASIVIMSHLGRPKGKKDPAFTLAPVALLLSSLLKTPVKMAKDCIGPDVEKEASSLKPGEILMLENLRFYAAEEKPDQDPSFAKNLAKLGDIYVNDAFGTAHRKHSSTAVIADYFPGKAVAGFLLEKEISALSSLLLHPKKPFYALIGGAKISTKMGVLNSLIEKVDAIFIGGGMFYTFMKAQGLTIGDSIHEDDELEEAKRFMAECKAKNVKVFLPIDVVIAKQFDPESPSQTIPTTQNIPDGWQGMDIGSKTVALWQNELSEAATVFWNGPFGVFEFPRFANGTFAIAKTLSTLPTCKTVVGGGDSVSAINQLNLASKFTHISTGGGASLEFIEFGHLPGIDALSRK